MINKTILNLPNTKTVDKYDKVKKMYRNIYKYILQETGNFSFALQFLHDSTLTQIRDTDSTLTQLRDTDST